MKIILTETGGLMGRTKTAEVEWPIAKDEFKELVESIKTDECINSKDGISYFIRSESLKKRRSSFNQ